MVGDEFCNANGLSPRVGTLFGELCNASGLCPRVSTLVGELCNASGLSSRLALLLVSTVTLVDSLPGLLLSSVTLLLLV